MRATDWKKEKKSIHFCDRCGEENTVAHLIGLKELGDGGGKKKGREAGETQEKALDKNLGGRWIYGINLERRQKSQSPVEGRIGERPDTYEINVRTEKLSKVARKRGFNLFGPGMSLDDLI